MMTAMLIIPIRKEPLGGNKECTKSYARAIANPCFSSSNTVFTVLGSIDAQKAFKLD
jgi:hypothetical protein